MEHIIDQVAGTPEEIGEQMQAFMHTVLLHRALRACRPREVEGRISGEAWLSPGDCAIERRVDAKIDSLKTWLTKRKSKAKPAQGEVVMYMYDKAKQKGEGSSQSGKEGMLGMGMNKKGRRIHWEKWSVKVDAEAERERVGESILETVRQVSRKASEEMNHIPPVAPEEEACFPFEISLPGESEASFSWSRLRRFVLDSSPPGLFA